MDSVYYIKEDKAAVQDYYADIIGRGLEKAGYPMYKTISINEINIIDKNSTIICISHYLTVKLWLKGFKNLLYWVQGTSPDESFMRNHSYFRKWFISLIEYIALQKAKCVFMVSQSMAEFYKKKYKKDFSYKTYIMPCYNSQLQEELFNKKGKYTNNTFCYVGGLSVWQCFEETVKLYGKIEKQVPNTFFRVFTPDIDAAKKVLESEGVEHYSVEFVKSNELVDKLAECKYGFILRGKSPVNLVATPTKLSNYLAAGLIPIVSTAVGFFNEILSETKYKVLLEDFNDVEAIKEISSMDINKENIINEYRHLFDIYYNTAMHITNIAEFLKKRNFSLQ